MAEGEAHLPVLPGGTFGAEGCAFEAKWREVLSCFDGSGRF